MNIHSRIAQGYISNIIKIMSTILCYAKTIHIYCSERAFSVNVPKLWNKLQNKSLGTQDHSTCSSHLWRVDLFQEACHYWLTYFSWPMSKPLIKALFKIIYDWLIDWFCLHYYLAKHCPRNIVLSSSFPYDINLNFV